MKATKEQLEKWDNPENLQEIKEELSIINEVEKIDSIVPKNATLPISYGAKNLNKIYNGVAEAPKKPIGVTIQFDDTITLPSSLNAYNNCIHNGACTLFETGNKVFTIDMLYRAINGLTNSEKVDNITLKKLEKEVDKMRVTLIDIYFKAQAENYNLDNEKIDSYRLNDYLLPLKKIEATTINGFKKTAYYFKEIPPVLKYSKVFNQVRTLPIELYNIKGLNNSNQITTIKHYLITQIESMKKKGKSSARNNVISYETLLTDCEIKLKKSNPSDTIKKNRDYIKKMLEQWKQQGYIKDFEEIKKARTFTGVKIILNEKK